MVEICGRGCQYSQIGCVQVYDRMGRKGGSAIHSRRSSRQAGAGGSRAPASTSGGTRSPHRRGRESSTPSSLSRVLLSGALVSPSRGTSESKWTRLANPLGDPVRRTS